MEAFLHGFILSLGLILPPGVQNIFLFNQGVVQSRLVKTMPAVITASLCDTLLIVLSVGGVSVLMLGSSFIKTLLIIGGVIFLVYMGWTIWCSKPPQRDTVTTHFTWKKQVMFAVSVSLLNPHAIMDTVGVIGPSSLAYVGQDKIMFAAACIIVSWFFFFGLVLVGRISGKLDKSGRYFTIITKISAVLMWIAAVYLLFTIV
ncbi:LysE/ArgO family amino acid transporter [Evansella sp. AB-rgal1]|uniref:LysE/ArgO family amino acid transporter n=1 Tax=Evansella sp. AB-rgal1 TaxID=3242696 RepID=UPI00359DFC57